MDATWTFAVELGIERWKLPCNKQKRTRSSQAQHQMEMECLHLTSHRKAPVKGIIGPGNGGLPCGIDDLQVLATGAGQHSLIL